jgi:L-amino acid N-acyltransferase YncA
MIVTLDPAADFYAGVAEVSVYVAPINSGFGIGEQLLQALIDQSENNGIWTLQAGIFPENIASLRIHEKTGFRQVGFHEKIGQMNGKWPTIPSLTITGRRTIGLCSFLVKTNIGSLLAG